MAPASAVRGAGGACRVVTPSGPPAACQICAKGPPTVPCQYCSMFACKWRAPDGVCMSCMLTLIVDANNEDMEPDGLREPKCGEPVAHIIPRLLHERAHGQAIDEAARPAVLLEMHPIPHPREDDGCGLAEAGRNLDQPRLAGRIFRQPTLIIVGLIAAGGGGEVLFEGHHACWFGVSPLSFSNGVGHPQGYRFAFRENTKICSRPVSARPRLAKSQSRRRRSSSRKTRMVRPLKSRKGWTVRKRPSANASNSSSRSDFPDAAAGQRA